MGLNSAMVRRPCGSEEIGKKVPATRNIGVTRLHKVGDVEDAFPNLIVSATAPFLPPLKQLLH
jgi:hypothetical protein